MTKFLTDALCMLTVAINLEIIRAQVGANCKYTNKYLLAVHDGHVHCTTGGELLASLLHSGHLREEL